MCLHLRPTKMSKKRQISTQEMMQYRARLLRQKEFLIDILSTIEKQITALQVERLHLRSTLLGSKSSTHEMSSDAPTDDIINDSVNIDSVSKDKGIQDPEDLNQQELDLSVLPDLNKFEEEVEDDEITEDEQELLEKYLL